MIRFLAPVVFLIICGFLFIGLYKDPSLVESPLIGKSIPTFSAFMLKDTTKAITNADLIGDISLVNVWATWCVACKQEHAALVQIARNEGVPIYGLNYKDDRNAAMNWLQSYGDPYVKNIFDGDGRIAIDFGVYGAPETFLIDQQGIIRHKLVGVMTPAIWQSQFVPIINQLASVAQ